MKLTHLICPECNGTRAIKKGKTLLEGGPNLHNEGVETGQQCGCGTSPIECEPIEHDIPDWLDLDDVADYVGRHPEWIRRIAPAIPGAKKLSTHGNPWTIPGAALGKMPLSGMLGRRGAGPKIKNSVLWSGRMSREVVEFIRSRVHGAAFVDRVIREKMEGES